MDKVSQAIFRAHAMLENWDEVKDTGNATEEEIYDCAEALACALDHLAAAKAEPDPVSQVAEALHRFQVELQRNDLPPVAEIVFREEGHDTYRKLINFKNQLGPDYLQLPRGTVWQLVGVNFSLP